MSKTVKKFFAGLLAFVMVFAMTAAAAPAKEVKADEKSVKAYLAYADSAWAVQYWGEDPTTLTNGVVPTNAEVTGPGQYTVGLDFTGAAGGVAPEVAFAGVMLDQAELVFPGSILVIDEVKVNGAVVEIGTPYTSSDDGITTRSNLYNAWVGELPEDARTASGSLEGCTPTPVSAETLKNVETIYVTFTVKMTTAYLAYADSAWAVQYWGEDPATLTNGVVPTNTVVTGPGQYTVGLDFTGAAGGMAPEVAFAGLMIDRAELVYPNSIIVIDEILVNGAAVEIGTPYTSSDDAIVTRSNLYNSWVTELPEDARTATGSLDGCTPTPVSAETLKNVETIYVTFTVKMTNAYLAFADSAWSVQYWGEDPATLTNGLKVVSAVVDGPGQYTVGLDFTGTANGSVTGLAFAAAMVDIGELAYPGYYMTVNSVEINGEKVEVGNAYTSSDDKIVTRTNLYNEWVTVLPDDAHVKEGNVADCTPTPLDKALFETPVETFYVTFTYEEGAAAPEKGLIGGTKYEGDMTVFLAMQGDVSASGAWDATFANGSTDVAGIVPTMVTNAKSGDTITIGLSFPDPVLYTWWLAPVVLLNDAPADKVTTLDYTIDKITVDGLEVVPDLTIGTDKFWYEGTADWTDTQAIRLMGGYNEWANQYIASPQNYNEIMYTITLGDVVTGQVEGELYDGEATMFLAGTAESAKDAWDWTWANGSTDNAAITGTVATVKSGDTVTLSLTYPSPVHHTWWMAPTLVLPEEADGVDLYNVLYTIDKVAIDGVDVTDKITLNKEADLAWYEGTEDHPVTRTLRLGGGYNEWGADNAKCMDGTLLEGFTSIEYTITLDAIYAEPKEEAPQLKADLDGTYNAYVGIQSGMYTFRNAWDDATYGRDTNPDVFAQMSFIESDQSVTKKAGTFKDTVIAGNGTYTLEINDLAWDDGSEALNLLFISTDIPKSGEIVFSNVKVDFDGKNVMEFDEAFLDGDSKEVIKILFINIWNKDITNTYNMAGMLPKSNVKITFDVSGFNYDKAAEVTPEPTPEPTVAPTEAPAEPTAAPTEAPAAPTEAPAEPTAAPTEAPADVDADAEGGMSPVVIAVIVVAVIAVAAGAAFVVMKKKK